MSLRVPGCALAQAIAYVFQGLLRNDMPVYNTRMENKHHYVGDSASSWQKIQQFYDSHPYPPPVIDLENYREKWQDENRRRADFHLFWPGNVYREDLKVLVAGCGTSQAARYAVRYPAAQVVGIDLSVTSIQSTLDLKKKFSLENLSVHQLRLEQVGQLEGSFDKIVCTGVLHHLPEPLGGLRALADVLAPGGALHLMVYAAYGRMGVYMLQQYARLLGVADTDEQINQFANLLMSLPDDHPLAPILGTSPDFRTRAGLADALLNPLDRAYTVPELLELISAAGLQFGRWLRQAPYLPQCGRFANSPHADRLSQLSLDDQYNAMELLRGTMLRHSAIAQQGSHRSVHQSIQFDDSQWLEYIPIPTPSSLSIQDNPPPGAAAVLINQEHAHPDLVLPIDNTQQQMYHAADGHRSISEIINSVSSTSKSSRIQSIAREFFQKLWWFDHIVFNTSRSG